LLACLLAKIVACFGIFVKTFLVNFLCFYYSIFGAGVSRNKFAGFLILIKT